MLGSIHEVIEAFDAGGDEGLPGPVEPAVLVEVRRQMALPPAPAPGPQQAGENLPRAERVRHVDRKSVV